MKFFAAMATALALAAPSYAATYYFDYSVGSSSGGVFFDYDTRTYGTGDLQVTGSVETDGTLGTIDETNILEWDFTISGDTSTLSISSDETTNIRSEMFGVFEATATTLTATDAYSFTQYVREIEFNRFVDYVIGRVFGSDRGTFGADRAMEYRQSRECTSSALSTCTDWERSGDYASTFWLGYNGESTQFSGTTVVAAMPLPAGAGFLLAAMGAFAVLRRRRQTAA